jgi:mRNA interferase MazF
MKIERGAVYLADLNPPRGTEPGKRRPVVVVQSDLLNPHHPSTLVCPLTTNVKPEARTLRVHLRAGEGGLGQNSDIMVDQLRAIDNRRLIKRLGDVPAAALGALSENLKRVLDL